MRILVHICCGPCGIMVVKQLLAQGHEPECLFFNPNIQPLSEYMLRRTGAAAMAQRLGVPMVFADDLPVAEQIWSDPWLPGNSEENGADAALPPAVDPGPWLRAVAGRESRRCLFCWRARLQKTAELALSRGYEAYTTSLLFSRHQEHERIREEGERIASSLAGPRFVYADFRVFWREGVALSRQWGIYRQIYCGCLFSEYERHSRDFFRLRAAGERNA
jgi:predicted adenine nucleotide alpha hydrolase (AANH) superfamily ATPase